MVNFPWKNGEISEEKWCKNRGVTWIYHEKWWILGDFHEENRTCVFIIETWRFYWDTLGFH